MANDSKLNQITETIENANPAIFAFLSTILPFLTPFPIAAITAISAETYLFAGNLAISWIFVAVLEGLGLLVTSYLTDAVLSYIKARNPKEVWKIILLAVVTVVYITLLIGLNVKLKAANSEADQTYLTVITLMCFLPLISGVLYGYNRFNRQAKRDEASEVDYQRQLENERWEKERQDRMDRYKIKKGVPLTQYQLSTPAPQISIPQQKKELQNSWKNRRHGFSPEELNWIMNSSRSTVAKKYQIPEGTAKNWIAGAKEELDRRSGHMDSPVE